MAEWLPRALIAGALAGGLAVAITVMIERWGGRIGGVLGTIPSTIVPASIGVYLGGDPVAFAEAMDSACAGMVVSAGFLWSWRFVPPRLPAMPLGRRLGLMIILSLGAWLLLASLAVLGSRLVFSPGETAWLGLGSTAALILAGLWGSWGAHPAPKGTRQVSLGMLVARGLGAGLAIATAIGLAHVFGGLVAGLAAVFPAIFLTAMAGLWISQGQAVPAGAAGPMMLGSSAVALYALAAKISLPLYGPGLGTLAAWVFAVVCGTLPASAWLRWRAAVRTEFSEPR